MGKSGCAIAFIFITSICWSLSSIAQKEGADTVHYTLAKKITWADFKAEPPLTRDGKVAQISATIVLRSTKVNFWTGKATFRAYAVLVRDKSWVRPGFARDHVLEHEQIHFDIAYINAKKMEKEINNQRLSISNKSAIDAIFNKWHANFLMQENFYDEQTAWGNDKKQQKAWQNYINEELQKLQGSDIR